MQSKIGQRNCFVLSPLMVLVLDYQPLSPTNIDSFNASSTNRDFPFNADKQALVSYSGS